MKLASLALVLVALTGCTVIKFPNGPFYGSLATEKSVGRLRYESTNAVLEIERAKVSESKGAEAISRGAMRGAKGL